MAHHLFRVVSGLDSLVVGEPQIAGQVKEAFQIASDRDFTGAALNRLFHCSFGVGKRVRTETGLGEGAVSVSYAAISLARKIFGDLGQLKALVVGAGEMAELTTTHQPGKRATVGGEKRLNNVEETPRRRDASSYTEGKARSCN